MIFTGPFTALDLGCVDYPMTPEIMGTQASELTGANDLHVEDYVTIYSTFEYRLSKVPLSKYQELLIFFKEEARLMLNTFDVQDDFGFSYVGRFASPSIGGEFSGLADGEFAWSGSLKIRSQDEALSSGGGSPS